MLSRREINQKIYEFVAHTASELVEANRNGDATYHVEVLDQQIINFLQANEELDDIVARAKWYRKTWEKSRINPTMVKTPEGQLELGFLYSPLSIVIYGKRERGFMKDMTFTGALTRLRLLNKSLKSTTDGVNVQIEYLTERMQVWDQRKYKYIDQLEKEVFGWQPPTDDVLPNPDEESEF